jgi:CDP-diacylglycerol--glycerol-3-phosphate 3-phosphatidyltransferase
MANALTVARLLLVAPFAALVVRGDAHSAALAAVLLVAAIATDLADGPVARRLGTVSTTGGTLDHTSDFLFVTSGLSAAAYRGTVSWVLPVLITAAFAQYFIDSHWVHRSPALRGSWLGRYNGILYFVPLGTDLLVCMGLDALRALETLLVWMLVVSTFVSMALRLTSAKRALELPAAETAGQSRR